MNALIEEPRVRRWIVSAPIRHVFVTVGGRRLYSHTETEAPRVRETSEPQPGAPVTR